MWLIATLLDREGLDHSVGGMSVDQGFWTWLRLGRSRAAVCPLLPSPSPAQVSVTKPALDSLFNTPPFWVPASHHLCSSPGPVHVPPCVSSFYPVGHFSVSPETVNVWHHQTTGKSCPNTGWRTNSGKNKTERPWGKICEIYPELTLTRSVPLPLSTSLSSLLTF